MRNVLNHVKSLFGWAAPTTRTLYIDAVAWCSLAQRGAEGVVDRFCSDSTINRFKVFLTQSCSGAQPANEEAFGSKRDRHQTACPKPLFFCWHAGVESK